MTLIIPPGFGSASIVFTGTVGTPIFVTTIGIDLSSAGGDFVLAANRVMASYATTLGAITDSALTIDRVTLAVGDDGPGGSVDSDLTPVVCGRSGTMAPAAMSAIVRKSTNDLGRRGRGRMFLPGVLTQIEVGEDGVIIPARITTLQAGVNAFETALANTGTPANDYPLVLLHSSAPADPSPITGLSVTPLVGWVRGRIR